MKGYLIALGVAIIAMSIIGGAFYLSGSYDAYQSRLHALGVSPGTPLTMFDEAKWQFARILGGGIIFGGLIAGSLLIGLGWIGNTLEEVRAALANELAEGAPPESLRTSKDSKS